MQIATIAPTVDWHYYKSAWFLITTPIAFAFSALFAAILEARS